MPQLPLGTANPIFTGGLGLMGIGAVLTSLRRIPARIWALIKNRLYLELEVDLDDGDAYDALGTWLAKNTEAGKSMALKVVSRWDNEGKRYSVVVPGDGMHRFTYKGAKILVTHAKERDHGKKFDKYTLTCRRKHHEVLRELVREADALDRSTPQGMMRLYMAETARGEWRRFGLRRIRPAPSIVLPGALFQELMAELRKFEAERDWYEDLGFPHRRGYLFEGPPGTGKSTLAAGLAGALSRDLYVLPLGSAIMTDESLMALLSTVPTNAVVLMEDIDTVFHGRQRTADNKLSMSGLLNALDGATAAEGRVLIMTTNHPEVLDPALVRPGRVDRRVHLGYASHEQVSRYFKLFYDGATDAQVAAFAAWAGDGTHTIAELQQHLIRTRDDPAAAVRQPSPEVVAELKAAAEARASNPKPAKSRRRSRPLAELVREASEP